MEHFLESWIYLTFSCEHRRRWEMGGQNVKKKGDYVNLLTITTELTSLIGLTRLRLTVV